MSSTDDQGLILHDGAALPTTTSIRKALAAGLDWALKTNYDARGGMEVEKPEDAYPNLRQLGHLSETLRDYGRAFTEAARKADDAAGADLIEMYGEQDGVPNQGAKVPDLDGTIITVGPDYVNEYTFDVDAVIAAQITSLLEESWFRKLLGAMFTAEFEGRGEDSTAALADVLSAAITAVLALGKFTPQVTKTRALARLLSGYGADGVASTITDATTKTVKHKGTKITRDQPKEK